MRPSALQLLPLGLLVAGCLDGTSPEASAGGVPLEAEGVRPAPADIFRDGICGHDSGQGDVFISVSAALDPDGPVNVDLLGSGFEAGSPSTLEQVVPLPRRTSPEDRLRRWERDVLRPRLERRRTTGVSGSPRVLGAPVAALPEVGGLVSFDASLECEGSPDPRSARVAWVGTCSVVAQEVGLGGSGYDDEALRSFGPLSAALSACPTSDAAEIIHLSVPDPDGRFGPPVPASALDAESTIGHELRRQRGRAYPRSSRRHGRGDLCRLVGSGRRGVETQRFAFGPGVPEEALDRGVTSGADVLSFAPGDPHRERFQQRSWNLPGLIRAFRPDRRHRLGAVPVDPDVGLRFALLPGGTAVGAIRIPPGGTASLRLRSGPPESSLRAVLVTP